MHAPHRLSPGEPTTPAGQEVAFASRSPACVWSAGWWRILVPHPARRIEEEIARIDKRCHPVGPIAEPGRTSSALLAGSGSETIAQ
jgi:hypothetical protein